MSIMPPPTTRASLLLRLRDSQDHDAWVEFVEIYEPAIYRQLRKSNLQDADARELAQEILLTVSCHIGRWELSKERGSFRGWLRRVTRNLLINWLKHSQRRMLAFGGTQSPSLFVDLAERDCESAAEFEAELRRSMFHRAAEVVRQRQHPKTWRAFWLTAVDGHTPAEVARQLEMNAGAVRVAKCRVLASLKVVVEELIRAEEG